MAAAGDAAGVERVNKHGDLGESVTIMRWGRRARDLRALAASIAPLEQDEGPALHESIAKTCCENVGLELQEGVMGAFKGRGQ